MITHWKPIDTPIFTLRTHGARTALVVLGLLGATVSARAATFSVGAGCTHSTLAAAALAAYLSPEDDLIKVTQNLTNQSVLLEDFRQSVRGIVTIRGGYSSCGDITSSGRSVVDGILSTPIFTVQTNSQTLSTVILENLELSGSTRGAVVTSGGQLTLNNVLITANRDGGVMVDGGTLVMNAASEINVNGWVSTVPASGGGIQCSSNGLLDLRGVVHNNRAELGAGLALFSGCQAEFRPGFWVTSNQASSNGGGVYLASGTVITGNGAGQPIAIFANNAVRGGGVYATGSGVLVLQDAEISSNTAGMDGGGVYASSGATVNLSASVGCDTVLFSCNLIYGNELGHDDGLGSAVYANNASVTVRQQRVRAQQSTLPQFRVPLFYAAGGSGELVLENLAISQNRATNLVEAVGGSTVTAGYISSSDNSYESGGTFPSAITLEGAGTTGGFFSSILWNHQAFFASVGSPTLTVDCVLTNSTVGIPGGSGGIATNNPGFINPLNGDLRLTSSSPAVDYCDELAYPDPGAPDLLGNSRPVDHPDNSNGSPGIAGGLFDIGAYEVQLVPEPEIFSDGFESGNVLAWSSSVGG